MMNEGTTVRGSRRDEGLSCREMVELVTEYIEGTLPRQERRRFERHLKGCPHCTTYVEQMRTVIWTLGKLDEDSLPPESMGELLDAFRGWKGQESLD